MSRSLFAAVGRFLREEDGPTTLEYAVMLMLILLVCITAIQAFARATGGSFSNSSAKLDEAFQ